MKTLVRLISFIGLTIGLSGCSEPSSFQVQSSAILGGVEADRYDVRYSVPRIVGPVGAAGTYSACTGVFVGPRIVLTAAHCISDAEAQHSAELSADGKKYTFRSQKIIIHPGYVKTRKWPDLAVIVLEPEPSERQAIIRPVPLLKIANAPESSFEILSTGYGKTSAATPADGRLRVVALRVAMYEPGLDYFRVGFPEGKGFCQGDSGGPALVASSGGIGLLGLAISTEEGCVYSGHYLNIPAFSSWIQNAIQ